MPGWRRFFPGILLQWWSAGGPGANAGRDVIGKIIAIMIPIAAFVAAGFEHSIANMYFIPMGLSLAGHGALQGLLDPAVVQGLTWKAFFLNNLIPVTIGNIIGGAGFVGEIYWGAYLRPAFRKDLAAKVRCRCMLNVACRGN